MKSVLKIFIAFAVLSYCSGASCDGEGSEELSTIKELHFSPDPEAENKTGSSDTIMIPGKEHLKCLNLYLCGSIKGGGVRRVKCTNPGATSWDLSKWKCDPETKNAWFMSTNLIKLECTENTQECISPRSCSLKYMPELTVLGLGIVLVVVIVATLLLVGLCCGIARCCCPYSDGRKSYR